MKLSEAMSQNVKTVSPQTAIKDAATIMAIAEVGMLPVVEPSGHVVGILTDRDLAIRCVARSISPERPVQEVMSQVVHAVEVDSDIDVALTLMRDKKVGRVIVNDKKGNLVGVLSFGDAILICNIDPKVLQVSEALLSRSRAAARLIGRPHATLI